MRKSCIISAILCLFLMTGCASTAEKQLIPGIHLGMTAEEVYGVIGREASLVYPENSFKNTTELEFIVNQIGVFDVSAPGYMFFEFDEDRGGILSCYGYHIGQIDLETPEYPLSEEELAEYHAHILEKLTEWYGEPGVPEFSLEEDEHVRSESAWETEDGSIWLVYGVNLWGLEEPERYEDGINEIIVSCSG